MDTATLTRLQVADALGDAFGPRGTDKATLLASAVAHGVHPDVVAVLERLPADRRFASMRELWPYLPEVPR